MLLNCSDATISCCMDLILDSLFGDALFLDAKCGTAMFFKLHDMGDDINLSCLCGCF